MVDTSLNEQRNYQSRSVFHDYDQRQHAKCQPVRPQQRYQQRAGLTATRLAINQAEIVGRLVELTPPFGGGHWAPSAAT
jgi:hypothetical protein